MIANPAGSFAASLAMDAVTSADIPPSIASRSTASAPNRGATIWVASMKPTQKRTGSVSASSHDSQEVTLGGLAAAQLDSSTLLPAPADPTTMVRRWPAPAASRSCSSDLVTSVVGSVVGRNFVSANRGLCEAARSAIGPLANTSPGVSSLSRGRYTASGPRTEPMRKVAKVTRWPGDGPWSPSEG